MKPLNSLRLLFSLAFLSPLAVQASSFFSDPDKPKRTSHRSFTCSTNVFSFETIDIDQTSEKYIAQKKTAKELYCIFKKELKNLSDAPLKDLYAIIGRVDSYCTHKPKPEKLAKALCAKKHHEYEHEQGKLFQPIQRIFTPRAYVPLSFISDMASFCPELKTKPSLWSFLEQGAYTKTTWKEAKRVLEDGSLIETDPKFQLLYIVCNIQDAIFKQKFIDRLKKEMTLR